MQKHTDANKSPVMYILGFWRRNRYRINIKKVTKHTGWQKNLTKKTNIRFTLTVILEMKIPSKRADEIRERWDVKDQRQIQRLSERALKNCAADRARKGNKTKGISVRVVVVILRLWFYTATTTTACRFGNNWKSLVTWLDRGMGRVVKSKT